MMLSLAPVYWKTAVCIGLVEAALLLLFVALVRLSSRRDRNKKGDNAVVVAFFHPRCTGGGGGERVLWKMVQVLGELSASGSNGDKKKQIQVIIYTIDAMTETYERDVRQHVLDRFSLHISPDLQLSFVHLDDYAHLLQPATRSFSLLVESLGAMRLAFVALQMTLEHAPLTVPHLFVDTTGCAFTYLPARLLFGCRVLAYVHYPTLSTDMLQRVWERRRTYNHAASISNSRWKTYAKLLYYVAFAALYGAVGSLATLVLVNSTWTYNHVRSLWKWAAWRNRIRIVYPPCSFAVPAAATKSRDDDDRKRNPVIVSIGQFRPEKDHVLQIESMARLLKQHPEWKRDQSCKLVLIGSCREGTTADEDDNDEARLQKLRQLCDTLEIADHVEFVVNQPFSVLQEWLRKASVGIHTMWMEHFGISIVESMAAGLIMIAHNSGGPKSDIIVPLEAPNNNKNKTTGFLASTADEYAERIHQVLSMDAKEAAVIRRNARESAKRFTDEVFAESFRDAMAELNLF